PGGVNPAPAPAPGESARHRGPDGPAPASSPRSVPPQNCDVPSDQTLRQFHTSCAHLFHGFVGGAERHGSNRYPPNAALEPRKPSRFSSPDEQRRISYEPRYYLQLRILCAEGNVQPLPKFSISADLGCGCCPGSPEKCPHLFSRRIDGCH